MRYLVIDLGNTNRKLAVFENDRLICLEQFPVINPAILREFTGRFPGITHCILASVIRHPASVTRFLASRYRLLELSEKTPLPLRNRYSTRATLGNDRLAAAVGAGRRFPGEDLLVVNAGSCITFDFISRDGEYLGGAISPGLAMRLKALHTFTGKLPLINLKQARHLIGTDTAGSILSGVVNGAIAEVEGIAGQYSAQFPGMRVILSGGDLKYFDKRLKISIFALPNIVIHGLYQILLFNVTEAQ